MVSDREFWRTVSASSMGVGHIHGNGWHRGSLPAWSSIARAAGCPTRERDDAAAVGAGVAELLVF